MDSQRSYFHSYSFSDRKFFLFSPLVPQHKRAVVLMENDKELRHGGVIRCPRERELNPPEKREKRVFH